MELQYCGANCIRITTKKAAITVDDNLATVGLKTVTKTGDIVLFTGAHDELDLEAKLLVDQPGEYEVSDISIKGVAARAHMDEAGTQNATMFKIISDDINLVIAGHIFADLNDSQIESLGQVDILVIPVGGMGYTLDGVDALKVIKKIDPRLIIPTHFADKAVKYEVPQQDLIEALKGLTMEPKETLPKLKIKASDLPIDSQLIVLERE